MSSQAPSYHGYRFPSEIISHAVWLYYRFALSFRDVEDLLAPAAHHRQLRDHPPMVPDTQEPAQLGMTQVLIRDNPG